MTTESDEQAARAAPAQDVTATEWNEMRDAMENCRLYAARHRNEEWAKTILDFCKEAGVTGSPLRAAPAQDAVPYSVWRQGFDAVYKWKKQRAAPAQPVQESGPWTAEFSVDGRCAVYSHDFTHDVKLIVSGDFENDEQKAAYTKEIARRLNAAAPAQPAERVLLARRLMQSGPLEWVETTQAEKSGSMRLPGYEYAWATIERIVELSPESVARVVEATKELLIKSEWKNGNPPADQN